MLNGIIISFIPHNQEKEILRPILLAEYREYVKIINDLLQTLEQVRGFLWGVRTWGGQWARWMISGKGWHRKGVRTCYIGTQGVRVKSVDTNSGREIADPSKDE